MVWNLRLIAARGRLQERLVILTDGGDGNWGLVSWSVYGLLVKELKGIVRFIDAYRLPPSHTHRMWADGYVSKTLQEKQTDFFSNYFANLYHQFENALCCLLSFLYRKISYFSKSRWGSWVVLKDGLLQTVDNTTGQRFFDCVPRLYNRCCCWCDCCR